VEMIEISASDFCDSVRDGTHDSPKPVEGHGRPLVTTKHMKGGRVSIEDAYLISEADFEKVNQRSQVHQWDVLISMIGTLGELVLVKDEPTYAIKNIGLFKTKSKYDGLWLYYYLQSPKAKNHMHTSAQGSTQQYLSLKTLRGFPLSVPDSETDKRAICEVLKTIDDKIELNQKMNQTLEEIAKAIFKSWFVDFDPVRAKAEGRPTGLPPEISDLFPDQLVDSGIGEIPKGWILSAFDDLVEEYIDNRGKTPPTENSGIPLVEIKHIYPNSLFPNLNTDKYVSKDTLESWFRKYVKKYDVLISTVGTIGLTSIVFNEEFAIAQNILGFRFKNESLSTFMFCMIKSMYFQNQINARLIETVQKSIKRKDLNTIPVLVPDENLIGRFFNIVNPLIERSYNNSCQNEVLSELRDTLLPKLISGELRIPDAEKFLEEAGI